MVGGQWLTADHNQGGPSEADVDAAFEGDNYADVTVLHADGEIAGKKGKLEFEGEAHTGGPEGHEVLVGDGSVDNPMSAEVHLVIRTHGPADSSILHEQLNHYAGGCGPAAGPPCDDIQFAIFPGSV